MKKAVIFDLDGVITDTAEFHYEAWKTIADDLGVYFDHQINERLKGVDRLASLRIILETSMRTFSDRELLTLADQKNRLYQTLIAKMTPEDVFPGVIELITQLKTAGFLIGLASVSKNANFVLERLKITALFDYVADANKIARSKPDPEIFLTVAENLGVHPDQCVGVEDAAAGVEAIKAAKMPAIGVGDPQILHQSNRVVGLTGQVTLALIDELLSV